MHKITLEVPKNIDSNKIESHLINQLKKETAKLIKDNKQVSYLSKLHEKVSKDTGLKLKSTADLIEQLQSLAKGEAKPAAKRGGRRAAKKAARKTTARKAAARKSEKKGGRKSRTAITPEFIATVKQLAAEGLNKSQITKKLSCSYPTVNKALAAK